jgi:hypothetical protein
MIAGNDMLTTREGDTIFGRYQTKIFPCMSTIVAGSEILPRSAISKNFARLSHSDAAAAPF